MKEISLTHLEKIELAATAIARTAQKARELNRQLSEMLESAGIDTNSVDFVSAYGYLEGDCDATHLIEYVKEQMECKG